MTATAGTLPVQSGRVPAQWEHLAAWARAVLLPLALTLWCLHSLAGPGYVLQIDAVFGPRMPLDLSGAGAPLTLVAHLLGGYWSGRLFLGLSLFLCGFGPMVLLRRLTWLAQVPAGLLGVLNPFVYDRVVEGQFGVAAGVGAVFLWLAAWEFLQEGPRPARLLLAAGAGWLAVVLDQHTIGPILVLVLVSLIWRRAWREPGRIVWGLGSLALMVVALSYAVPPFFFGHHGGTYATVRRFSRADLVEFRSTPSPLYGLWVNLLGLYGFWAERLGRIPMVNAGAAWWPLASFALTALALAGAWLARERVWLLGTGLLGLLIAGSTGTGTGQRAFLWLMQRLPLVGAYREPEKWSGLWLVALVVLGAAAVDVLARSPGRAGWARGLALTMVAATLLPAGAGMLRELPATVRPAQYPRGWGRAATYMERHIPAGAPILVLPWTLYEELPFTGNLLTANPATVYFPGHLTSPNDLQIPGAVTEAHAPGNLTQLALDPLAPDCALARGIRQLGYHWVIVEPAPGGQQAASALLGCGFAVRSGTLPGLVVVQG
ncbi:MAG: hypothetical protein ACYCS9_01055 [Candidatus Dormibacteria bacterium]